MARVQAKKQRRSANGWNSGDILVMLAVAAVWLYIVYAAIDGLLNKGDYFGVLMLAASGVLGLMVFKGQGRWVSLLVIVFAFGLGIFGFLRTVF